MVRARLMEELQAALQAAPDRNFIIYSQVNIYLKNRQYNDILNGGLPDTKGMTAFCRILEIENNKRPCKVLAPALYEALTNTNEKNRDIKRGKI